MRLNLSLILIAAALCDACSSGQVSYPADNVNHMPSDSLTSGDTVMADAYAAGDILSTGDDQQTTQGDTQVQGDSVGDAIFGAGDDNGDSHVPCLSPGSNSWLPSGLLHAPVPRYGHTALWCGSSMLIFGGEGGDGSISILRDAWAYSPYAGSWSQLPLDLLQGPQWRMHHSAVWTGTEMIIWGGQKSGPTRLNCGARYHMDSSSWYATSTTNAPLPRSRHTAVWALDEMLVWGGLGPSHAVIATGGRYTPSLNTWQDISTIGAPSPRAHHSAVWTGQEMIIWGGWNDGSTALEGAAAYNPVLDQWRQLSTAGAPPATANHVAVWTGENMLVWGGNCEQPCSMNTGGMYSPDADSWRLLPGSGAPTPRFDHAAVWTGTEFIVWGGFGDDPDMSPATGGGAYSVDCGSWRSLSMTAAPDERGECSAVWTGSQMIVWGGWFFNDATYEIEYFNSGGQYSP